MLSIGELARATGLTVKALRHYDERGLLAPARVDPSTRHREYSGAQIRAAVLIKALRAANLPVEAVRRALGSPEAPRNVVAEFRTELTAARAAQDVALESVEMLLSALEQPSPVGEGDAAAQHFAGVALRVPADADELDVGAENDRANLAFGRLHAELSRRGNPPTGSPWTGVDVARGDPATADLLLCWPVEHPVGRDLALDGLEVRTGTLPARRELVARCLHEEDDLTPRGLPHPTMIALLSELARREQAGEPDPTDGMTALRQVIVMGDDGPIGVELAIDLAREPVAAQHPGGVVARSSARE